MNINQILKDRRIELGISQTELAQHCGFAHRSNISRLENGKLEWKFRDIIKATELLGLDLSIKENDNLTKELFDTLDDEVMHCLTLNLELSEKSLKLLVECQKQGIGKSAALKALIEKNEDGESNNEN